MVNLKIRERFTSSLLSAITAFWEICLSPALVLPAFISYLHKNLQPYVNSKEADKIFLLVNNDTESERAKRKKVPRHFFATTTTTTSISTSISTSSDFDSNEAVISLGQ